jgi:hypothetical protein
MNPIKKPAFLLLLTVLAGVTGLLYGQVMPPAKSLYTLYPPLNPGGNAGECFIYLNWQKPQMPSGATPAGLVGYYIYRDGIIIHYNDNPDLLTCVDFDLLSGTYAYTVTANYDLTTYGFPGQFGESPPAGPVNITIICDFPFPFDESWDIGMFANSWQFNPSQSNWAISTSQGNPAPTALFNGTPGIQDYEVRLESHSLFGKPWVCANMYLEFDYKLTDVVAGGTEKLTAEYNIDNTWYPVFEITNQGLTGWVHQKIDISQVCGKNFKIGFRVSGVNSVNITSWSVDNIQAYAECKGPTGCDFTKSGNIIHLFWQPPQCDSLQVVAGYNVYRNECNGPIWAKMNGQLILGLNFFDSIPASHPCTQFRYLVAAAHKELSTNSFMCEGYCDTLAVDLLQGIGSSGKPGALIFPNPASDYIRVKSDSHVGLCELLNCMGQNIMSIPAGKQTEITIPISGLSNGIYLVRIKNAAGNFIKKVSVIH